MAAFLRARVPEAATRACAAAPVAALLRASIISGFGALVSAPYVGAPPARSTARLWPTGALRGASFSANRARSRRRGGWPPRLVYFAAYRAAAALLVLFTVRTRGFFRPAFH